MFSRMQWSVGGAVVAVGLIITGAVLINADSNRQENLIRENERLARTHEALRHRAEQLEQERLQLAKVAERLSLERRVAEIEVIQQHTDEDGRVLQTVIRLTELDPNGRPLPAQTFGVSGRMPHFDALVIKFNDEFVAAGDSLRGRSLALFRRVYSENQAPEDGFWLGRRGDIPDVYRTHPEPSPLEIELWDQFWSYAANPAKAALAGVRVAQGEAVYAPVLPGERWLLTLEADGGLNLIKQSEAPAAPDSLAGQAESTPPLTARARLHVPSPLETAESPG